MPAPYRSTGQAAAGIQIWIPAFAGMTDNGSSVRNVKSPSAPPRGSIMIAAMPKTKSRVLAIGTFDGVHLGHRKLLKTLLSVASKRRLVPSVALFDYSPRLYLKKEKVVKLLTSIEERAFLINEEFGIKEIMELPMNRRFFTTSAWDFLKDIVVGSWGVKSFVCGENFALGRDRACSVSNFKNFGDPLGLSIHVVRLQGAQHPVSSTLIRGLLADGDLAQANALLGRSYALMGEVIRGERIASKALGFPTANLTCDPAKILPLGVFRAWVCQLQKWAVVNIGFRPTLAKATKKSWIEEPSVEAHILGFKGSLYGKTITLELDKKLRSERRFKDLTELRRQIVKDIASVEDDLV